MATNRQLIASALAVAALGSVALAGPASAAKTSTSLSIQTEQDGVSGFVKSSKSSCHSSRNVKIYRKVSGPDKKAGSDIATPNQDGSQYKVSLSRSGRYYAKVHATSKCKGKTSKTVSFSPDTGEDATAAHTLSRGKAAKRAQEVGNLKVRISKGEYVKATVKSSACKQLFPHRVRCRVHYDSEESLPTNKYECSENFMLGYNAHKNNGERDYDTVYYGSVGKEC